MNQRHKVAQSVVPGAPLVTVDGLIVGGIDIATEVLPTRQRKLHRQVLGVEFERDQTSPGEVLALVEF